MKKILYIGAAVAITLALVYFKFFYYKKRYFTLPPRAKEGE